MKKISIVIPTYNEENNISPIVESIVNVFDNVINKYDYEILIIDNCSTDNTRVKIKQICNDNYHAFAIFNMKNYGAFNSSFHGILQANGDAAIFMVADFQDPVEMIPKLLSEWENGYKIVAGKNTSFRNNNPLSILKTQIINMSGIDYINHFTGFGLYDKSFINVLKAIDDPMPLLNGLIAELGYKIKIIEYKQNKRKNGNSKHSLYQIYDSSMLSFTSYTKVGLRIITVFSFLISIISLIISILVVLYKLIYSNNISLFEYLSTFGLFFLFSIIFMILGFIGEYIISINQRLMKRPLVIEESRYGIKYNNVVALEHNNE